MVERILKTRGIFWMWCALLLIPIGIGLYSALQVFTKGLVVTNLSDLAPWGLWIVVDLSCIALSAGAFSLSALAHLFGRDNFKPIARVAVFVGLLGYTGAMMCLLLDIGRPERFWHGWVFWQTHSMLWEVTMCITLYFSVLLLEVFPMIVELPLFNRFKWLQNLGHRIHRFAPILAIMGMGLSLLHQSSLGGTYGVVAGRASLYRATMPLLFIVSAVAAGMAFTVQMTLIVQWLKRRVLVPRDVLFQVGQVAGAILFVYLYMRFWDSTAGAYGYVPGRSESDLLLTTGTFGLTFWGWEIILGGIVAGTFLIMARRRNSIGMLLMGSGLTMAGIIANRWNTTMLAFTQPLSTEPVLTNPASVRYLPSLVEWGTALGIVAGLTLAFSLGMRFLPAYKGHTPTPVASSGD
ncbi:MAG: polysulfide reductase NrfD [Anaerolinea sp.]|nr:polysulfide reductase NrfD [Anaerolinea sp.]CAG1005609.1 Menaquinone reductase, integral membrane subunit [Anaerolineae bacterium]